MIKKYSKFISVLLLIIVLLLPLFLSSCWDYRDINRRSIDLSIGVDEVDDNIEYSGEIAKLAVSGSAMKGQTQITEVYKHRSLGKDLEDSRRDYDSKLTNPIFLGAVRVIVFSKKYAEKKGIEAYINRSNFSSEFRNSVLVAISKEPTNDLYSGKVENDICIGYAIENTIRQLSEKGKTLYKTAQGTLSDLQGNQTGCLLPYVTKDKNVVKYLGFAVIKQSKLIAIITSEDTNGFLFILSKKPTITLEITHPTNDKNAISIKTVLKKRSIKTSYENKKINIYIDLKVNAQIQYAHSIEPISKEDIEKIETIISSKIKNDITSAVTRSKDEFKCDVFNFAHYFKINNTEEYKKLSWKDEYSKANVYVNVETTVINSGLLNPKANKSD